MKPYLKWTAIVVGSIITVSHIGILGHVMTARRLQHPIVNLPEGDYSSYRIVAGPDGYEIEYRANDPKVLTSERHHQSGSTRQGIFGGGSSSRTEHRVDEYTMDGARNIDGGALVEEGKLGAENVECIVADAGARSQGAMAGTAISAGVIVPAVSTIPYVGWLASGWALLLGENIGSEAGSMVGGIFNDC